jgi:hypothetical protein
VTPSHATGPPGLGGPSRDTLIGVTAHTTYLHSTVTTGPITSGEVVWLSRAM